MQHPQAISNEPLDPPLGPNGPRFIEPRDLLASDDEQLLRHLASSTVANHHLLTIPKNELDAVVERLR